mgnify:CR=1 FL=1
MKVADVALAKELGAMFRSRSRVLIVCNEDKFFLTHRASWAVALDESGCEVMVAATDTGYRAKIEELGFEFLVMPSLREGVGPLRTLTGLLRLLYLYLRVRPNKVLLIGTAAYTVGCIPTPWFKSTDFVRFVTGNGRLLDTQSPFTGVAGRLWRRAARAPNVSTVFQTSADLSLFTERQWADPDRTIVIRGTGIDTQSWTADREPRQPTAMFAGRLFDEKGVPEFIEIAKRLATIPARFVIVGTPDLGVASATDIDALRELERQDIVEYWGPSNNMSATLGMADVILLPTRHPEGTPRILIEAGASGLPVIASDIPGCREVVDSGVTGVLIPVQQVDEWVAAASSLLQDQERRTAMGKRAREKIEREFGLAGVVSQLFAFIGIEAR